MSSILSISTMEASLKKEDEPQGATQTEEMPDIKSEETENPEETDKKISQSSIKIEPEANQLDGETASGSSDKPNAIKEEGPSTKYKPKNESASAINTNPDVKPNETATALRIIADCEDIPPPELTSNIDFRKVYHQMANAMEGKPIEGDPETNAVLKLCFTETAKRLKGINNPKLKEFIDKLNTPGATANEAPPNTETTDDPLLNILRYFCAQEDYNPLNVPEALLKLRYNPSNKKSK